MIYDIKGTLTNTMPLMPLNLRIQDGREGVITVEVLHSVLQIKIKHAHQKMLVPHQSFINYTSWIVVVPPAEDNNLVD